MSWLLAGGLAVADLAVILLAISLFTREERPVGAAWRRRMRAVPVRVVLSLTILGWTLALHSVPDPWALGVALPLAVFFPPPRCSSVCRGASNE